MSRVRVNYKSDLPPIEVTFKLNGVAIDVPDHDFAVRFFIDGSSNSYYCGCSYDGETPSYYNCAPSTDGSKLICYINNHDLMPGRLQCEYVDLAGNANYEDGVFKTVVPYILDIVLVDGVGDIPSSISAAFNERVMTRGIASIEKTASGGGESGLVDTYTVTFTDGSTTTFEVTNGEKGDQGIQGETGATGPQGLGFSSIVAATPNPDGTVLITLTNGDTITLNMNHVHNKTVISASDATVTLDAHAIYDLGTVAGNKTINLPTTVDLGAEYEFRLAYTSGTISGTAISGTTVANDATLTFTAGKTYQVIISGGILYFSETTTPS